MLGRGNRALGAPSYIRGLREIEVKEWMLMEGSMTVTLNFAERTLDLA